MERFEESVALILDMPEAFPEVHGELRRALLRRFPYSVYYRLLDSEHLESSAASIHAKIPPSGGAAGDA